MFSILPRIADIAPRYLLQDVIGVASIFIVVVIGLNLSAVI